jgi:hypothetical protein
MNSLRAPPGIEAESQNHDRKILITKRRFQDCRLPASHDASLMCPISWSQNTRCSTCTQGRCSVRADPVYGLSSEPDSILAMHAHMQLGDRGVYPHRINDTATMSEQALRHHGPRNSVTCTPVLLSNARMSSARSLACSLAPRASGETSLRMKTSGARPRLRMVDSRVTAATRSFAAGT